jgi:hypothetical protein
MWFHFYLHNSCLVHTLNRTAGEDAAAKRRSFANQLIAIPSFYVSLHDLKSLIDLEFLEQRE